MELVVFASARQVALITQFGVGGPGARFTPLTVPCGVGEVTEPVAVAFSVGQ
jgi:hypothetical protein